MKLLAFDFTSLTQTRSHSKSFTRKGIPISRVESLGTVVSRDLKPSRFLKFKLDDGTGCIACILWLNQLSSNQNPSTVRLIAQVANHLAEEIKMGRVARVRGRVTGYRGRIQITVSDIVIERDPNAQILHWLECIRLARKVLDSCK